jgi:hypothetical protein
MPGWGRARLKEGQIPRTTRLEMQQQTDGLPSWGWDCHGRVPQRPDREKAFSSCGCGDPCRSETAVELQAAACEIQENCIQKNTEQLSVRFAKQENRRHRFKMLSAVGTGSNVHQFKTWSGDGLDLQSCTASEPGQASMCSAGG